MEVYNKLIRDRIPEIIEKNGSKLKIRTLSVFLIIKIIKESY
jgi:predicted house-cleaning noncanonical NTP pyrophosphatase (MazG superfamily)